jgi:hypothetical protein
MSDVTPSKADEPADESAIDATPAADGPDHEPVSEPLADVTSDPAVETSGETGPVLVEPQESAAPETAEFRAAVAEPAGEPVGDPNATGEVAPVVVPAAVSAVSAVPAQQIYVQPDLPPKKRGNRLVGTLLSIVGGALFAGLYAVVSAIILDLREHDLFGPDFVSFLSSAFFWVPVVVFLVGLILLVLVLNRSGWWAHVFGSLILAIAVYFAMIGVLLLIGNVFHGSPTVVTFAALAVNPWVIAAAVVAREVSIWTGLGIAARGRRVKVRNVEARAAFDREQDAKKAEYAGTGPVGEL